MSSAKRQKKGAGSGQGQSRNTLLDSQFTMKTVPKRIDKKIALTDEVYHPRDRDDSVKGYVYIYRVKEEIRTAREVKLKCEYLDQRIKVGDPMATKETHTDTDDLQAVEYQVIDITTYECARQRYNEHCSRIKLVEAEQRKEAEANVVDSDAVTNIMTAEEEEELWCEDLKNFVSEYGVNGKDESGSTLLDLQFELIGVTEKDSGDDQGVDGNPPTSVRKRRNVSNHSQVFNDYDTGGMWKKLRSIARRTKGKRDRNFVRARLVIVLCNMLLHFVTGQISHHDYISFFEQISCFC